MQSSPASSTEEMTSVLVVCKKCSKCGEDRLQTEFGKDRRRPDGLFPQCKRCRLVNPSKSDEVSLMSSLGLRKCSSCKGWLAADHFYHNASSKDGLHGQCKSCSLSAVKSYREANLDTRRDADRLYREANKEKMVAKWAKYYTDNKHKLILRAHAKRREYNPELDTLTGPEWVQILRDQDGLCGKCLKKFNAKFTPTRDHILPLSKGGYLTKENTQALCRPCNTSKGTKTTDYRVDTQLGQEARAA